jgi:REP element-mobilizing transposase RayT
MALLDHCLTSNHVHLLVDAEERLEVWTESLAVGSNSIVEKIQPLIMSRSEIEIVETDSKLWVLRESPAPYGQETYVESACKATK